MKRFLEIFIICLTSGLALQSGISRGKFKEPVVILPGFGNDKIDYVNPLKLGTEYGFKAALEKRGYPTYIVDVERKDWLRVSEVVGIQRED